MIRKAPMKRKVGDPRVKTLVRKAMSKTPKGSRSKWMKRADTVFSKYIRQRYADENGMVSCITCGKVKHWKEVDCGHYVSRAKQSTRYDTRNSHAQCKGCNQWQGGRFVEHGFAIDKLHGEGTYRALLEKGMMECKRGARHFEAIALEFEAKLAELHAEQARGKYRRA